MKQNEPENKSTKKPEATSASEQMTEGYKAYQTGGERALRQVMRRQRDEFLKNHPEQESPEP